MVNRQIDAMAELQNALSVLFKNWILAIPTALVFLIAGVLAFFVLAATFAPFMAGGAMGDPKAMLPLLATAAPAFLIFFVVVVLLSLVAQAIVIGGAEHVWHGQPADLAGGIGKAMGKLPQLILLFVVAAVIAFVCSALIIAAGLGLLLGLVLLFFFMYTLPAIVLGNQGVFEAMGTSWRLVRANLAPSIIAFLGIVVVAIVCGIILQIFDHLMPILAIVANFAIGGLQSAYITLVTVRFYDLLRGATA